MARPNVLIAHGTSLGREALRVLETETEVTIRDTSAADLPTAFAEFDAIWIRLAHRVDAATLSGDVRCRLLAVPATGLDHIDLDACARSGVRIVSLRGESEFLQTVRATAEHTIGLMLAVLRGTLPASQSVLEGRWDREAFRGSELFERRVAVLGYGRLGRLVAGYLRAFGSKVAAFDARPEIEPELGIEIVSDQEELLRWGEVLTIHVSLEDSSHNLIGRRELECMPRGSYLVNTSRGAVLDEVALLSALQSGHLAGAALDVIADEWAVERSHPVVRHALHNHNLLITPHIGGNTRESGDKTDTFVATRLVQELLGGHFAGVSAFGSSE